MGNDDDTVVIRVVLCTDAGQEEEARTLEALREGVAKASQGGTTATAPTTAALQGNTAVVTTVRQACPSSSLEWGRLERVWEATVPVKWRPCLRAWVDFNVMATR